MKAISIVLLFLSSITVSFSQDKESTSGKGSIKMEELPAVVIKSAGKDFSVYLPDRNSDPTVREIEDQFIAYDLGRDFEGFDSYLVIMQTAKGSLTATYNQNGKLTSVIEIYKAFPGWQIINDKYLYTQKEGDVIKKEYNIRIKKDKEIRKLVVSPFGEIIKGK
jgi:hypothetical protein